MHRSGSYAGSGAAAGELPLASLAPVGPGRKNDYAASPMRAAPEILLQQDGVGVARCGPVFFTIFYAPPTVERLEALVGVQRRVMTREKHAIVSLIDPGVGKEMKHDARKRAAAISAEMDQHTVSQALIVLGKGFVGATVRSVIAGIQMWSGPQHPWKVVSETETGLVWTIEQLRAVGKDADLPSLRVCASLLFDATIHKGPA